VVYLADTNGTVYTYLVSNVFAVSAWETWVTKPIPGRDVVTLQTCTESVDDWWTPGLSLFARDRSRAA
jgi:sortase A